MKSLDAFGKPIQEFQVKTACGGYLSVCSFLLIFLLFITELRYFLQLETKDEMVIDQNQEQKYLNISFSLTVFQVPCSVLRINLIDPKKANVMHVIHEIYKTRINGLTGKPFGQRTRDSLAGVAQTSAELEEAGSQNNTVRAPHVTPHLRCGSCFQSHIDEDDCCNSCEDLRAAFKSRGWNEKPEDYVFAQCEDETYVKDPPQAKEGCRIDAKLHVRKVASTIHLGVGRYFKPEHVKTENHKDYIRHLNFSHEIRHLSFGPEFPGLVHVLDGRVKNNHVPPNSEHFQYDIHVIPSRYIEEDREINSHQYSVTEYVKSIDQRARHQELVAVGLWANYDFTPFEVKVTKSRKSFMHFLTECCAILGGVFAFSGMLDNFAYRINMKMARRSNSRAGASSLTAVGLRDN